MSCFRRGLSALFARALAILIVSPRARAATGDATILKSEFFSGVSVKGLAQSGDALILLLDEYTYCTWTRADGLSGEMGFDALSLEAGESVGAIFQDSDGPYALSFTWEDDEYEGTRRVAGARAWRLSLQNGRLRFGESISLDWPEAEDDGSDPLESQVYWPFVDGNLFVFSVGQWRTLMTFDLETGAAREIEIPMAESDEQIEGLTGYGGGYALIVTYSFGKGSVSFYGVDLETGESKRLFKKEKADGIPGGLAYDKSTDWLFYVYRGELLRVEGLDPKTLLTANTIQIESGNINAALLTADGYYVCSDRLNVLLRNTDPDARAKATLNVSTAYNYWVKQAADPFMAKNPDVDVILMNEAPDVITAMMSRSDAVDIYTFDLNSSQFAALYERGFLADLSGSTVLSAYVGEMYPVVRNAVTKDGALLAIPVNERLVTSIAYVPSTLEKLGLTKTDLPATWSEFLAFLAAYPSRYGDMAIPAFSSRREAEEVREDLLNQMIADYVLYMQTAQDVLSFDTELFRALIAEFEKVDFSALVAADDQNDEDSLFGIGGRLNCDAFQSASDPNIYYVWPLPLSISEDAPLISWELTVSFVNPYSQNYDAAVEYLEVVTDEVGEHIVIDLCPDRNDPIENEGYEEEVIRRGEEIEGFKALIGQVADGTADLDPDYTADEEERMLHEVLAQSEEALEFYRESGRYELSPESIATFRAYGESFAVQTYPGFDLMEYEGEFQEQVSMYLDGLNDADTFIGNIEDMARMMIREGM